MDRKKHIDMSRACPLQGGKPRHQRHRRISDIDEHADAILQIECPRHFGDVGRGNSDCPRKASRSGFFFSEKKKNLPMAIFVEPVDHDPVIARDRFEQGCCFVAESEQRGARREYVATHVREERENRSRSQLVPIQ